MSRGSLSVKATRNLRERCANYGRPVVPSDNRERLGIIVIVVYGVALCVWMLIANGHLG
jgi:hypothetical protein